MTERLLHLNLILFLGVFVTTLSSVDAKSKSIFVFGDSQFDPGNNQFIKNCTLRANFKPYGSNFFHYPTGRFTNGRTVVDFIAQYLGIKFQKPYQEVYRILAKGGGRGFPPNGLNFASAGSGLFRGTNKDAAVTPIQVQLQQFQALITQKLLHKKQIEKSLFFIISGANDVFFYFLSPGVSKMTQKTYVRAMLKEMEHFTSKIYKYGGRRIVLFSIGIIGCIPGRVLIQGAPTNRCIDKMDNMARYYNTGLKHFVKKIPRMFPGAIGVYAAVYDTSKKYFDNPKIYGTSFTYSTHIKHNSLIMTGLHFKMDGADTLNKGFNESLDDSHNNYFLIASGFANVTHACCGGGPLNGKLQCGLKGYTMCLDPNEYFFWDYFHPSERTYGLVSKAIWAGGKEEIWPMNLNSLAHHSITSPFP